jgi:hypothetical protein
VSTSATKPHVATNLKHRLEQGLAADVAADQRDREIVHGARGPPAHLPVLSALELERHITVEEAAAILGIHVETFESTYSHLIKKVSPRCRRVKLRALLAEESGAASVPP